MLGRGPANKNTLKILLLARKVAESGRGRAFAALAASCRFHLALAQSQREKLVISQFSPLGRLRLAQVHSNIGITSSMRQNVVKQRACSVQAAADVDEQMDVTSASCLRSSGSTDFKTKGLKSRCIHFTKKHIPPLTDGLSF